MFDSLQRRMLWLTCGLGVLALLPLSGVVRAQPNGPRLHAPPAFGPRLNANPGRGGNAMVQTFPQFGTQIYGQFLTSMAIQGQVQGFGNFQGVTGFGNFNGFSGFGNQFNGFNGFNGQFGGQFGFNGFGNQFGFGNFQGVNGFGNFNGANGFGNQFNGNFGNVQGFGNVNGVNGFGNGGFNGFNNGFGNVNGFGFFFPIVASGWVPGIGNPLPGGQGLQNGGKGFGFSGESGY